MKQAAPKSLTVLIDSREKNPLTFPKNFVWHEGWVRHMCGIKTKVAKMKTGDYALEGYEGTVLVERKSGLHELYQNLCTKDSRRFHRCLERLRTETRVPMLFLDCGVHDFEKPTRYCDNPEMVLDRLFAACVNTGVQLIWYPINHTVNASRRAGGFVLRAMWAAVTSLRD